MMKVLFTQVANPKALEYISKYAEAVVIKEGNLDELKLHLKDSSAIILGTWIKFTEELMNAAPKLKVISRTGAGVDNVDVKAATKKNILVLNTPEANSISVAEHTVSLILALAKSVVFLDDQVRKGNFSSRRLYLPVDLQEKTIGLVGCGRIGLMVAEKCRLAFNMKVIAYDPFITIAPAGIKLVNSIEEIFIQSDFISLHIPLIESTRNIVNEKLLSLMKSTAYLINTARGGIIDEKALKEKLQKKEIAGAALDVFSKEPPDLSDELFHLDNIILTPHTAALTKECTARVAMEAVQGVVDFIQGRSPKFVYN